ncbi:MAG: dihydrodipicolinate synthase family protein [Bacilli bacterium]
MNFGRLITAMATPFNDDGTSIDYKQTEVLIDHLIATGTKTIIVAGTTG